MAHWTEEMFVEGADVFLDDLEERVEAAGGEVEDLLALLSSDHDLVPETALDVACGIGRHAVALADRGVEATGVDISPAFVERARERAADAGVADRTRFVEGDMRDLDAVGGRYDLVLNAWTAFGYYDDETNREVMAGLADRVAPGGALALELANKEGVLGAFDPDGVVEFGGRHVVERREYDPATSRMRTDRWVVDLDGGEIVGTYEIDLRAYAPVELKVLCEAVGFEDVSLYGGLDGADLTRESSRLVVVAR